METLDRRFAATQVVPQPQAQNRQALHVRIPLCYSHCSAFSVFSVSRVRFLLSKTEYDPPLQPSCVLPSHFPAYGVPYVDTSRTLHYRWELWSLCWRTLNLINKVSEKIFRRAGTFPSSKIPNLAECSLKLKVNKNSIRITEWKASQAAGKFKYFPNKQ